MVSLAPCQVRSEPDPTSGQRGQPEVVVVRDMRPLLTSRRALTLVRLLAVTFLNLDPTNLVVNRPSV